MKTQCTVETSDSVRTLVALRVAGELRLASRNEVREYFDGILALEVEKMETHIRLIVAADQVAELGVEFPDSHEVAAGEAETDEG